VIISINHGSWGEGVVMVIRIDIDFGKLVKVALRGRWEKGWVGGGSGKGDAGFCGPCVCLGVFLLCSGGCLCQGLQGAWLCTVGTVG
jgi:hypothetical protein